MWVYSLPHSYIDNTCRKEGVEEDDDGEGGGGGGGGFTTCSLNLVPSLGDSQPSTGICAPFEVGLAYCYPEVSCKREIILNQFIF